MCQPCVVALILLWVFYLETALAPAGSWGITEGIRQPHKEPVRYPPSQIWSWRNPEGAASQLSPWNSNVTDGKKCFPSAGQTVTNAMWCTEGERERIKIPQQDNTPLEHMDLPKPCQMRKQVQVRRHQGNMKKEKKNREQISCNSS